MEKKENLTVKETFTLAVQNHQKNNIKDAENLYKEILKTNPNHFQANLMLGTLSAQIKKPDIAIQLLQKAIEILPDHAVAHNNLGLAFKQLGENEKAKIVIKKL